MDNLLLVIIPVALIFGAIALFATRTRRPTEGKHMMPEHRESQPDSKTVSAAPAASDQTYTGQGPRVVNGSDFLQNGRYRHFESTRKGKEGEERVVEVMAQTLSSEWTIFRNVDLRGGEGDIDLVLVGPAGVWAVEVKTFSGKYKVENGSWSKQTSNGYWCRYRRGPGAQVMTNARALYGYLEQQGIRTRNRVEPVVVSAGDAQVDVRSTGTEVWKLDELPGKLVNLNSRIAVQADQERVVKVLEAATRAGNN